MPDDKKEVPKAQELHREDRPDMDRGARLSRRSAGARGRSQYSQYEDYIRQAKAAITGV
jgi:hypothetical protein